MTLVYPSYHMDRFSTNNVHNSIPSPQELHYEKSQYTWSSPVGNNNNTKRQTVTRIEKDEKLRPSIIKKEDDEDEEEEDEEESTKRTTTVTITDYSSTTVCCMKDIVNGKTINTINEKNIPDDAEDHKDNVICVVVTAEKNNQSDRDDDSDDDEDEIIDVVGITENHQDVKNDNIENTATSTTCDADLSCCDASCVKNTYHHCCPAEDSVTVACGLHNSSSPTIQYSRCKINDNVSVVGSTDASLWTTQVIEEGFSTPSTPTVSPSEDAKKNFSMSYTEQCYNSRGNRKRPLVTVISHRQDQDDLQSSKGPSSPKRAFILSNSITKSPIETDAIGILRHDENALIERNSAFKTVKQQHSMEPTVSEKDEENTNSGAISNEEEETIPYLKPNETKSDDQITPTTLSQSQVNIIFNPIYGTRGIEKYFQSIPMNDISATSETKNESEPDKKGETVKLLPVSNPDSDNKSFPKKESIPQLFQNGDNNKALFKTDQRKDFVIKHGEKLFGNWVPAKSEEESSTSSFLSNLEKEEDSKKILQQQKDSNIKEEVQDGEENNLDRQSSPTLNKNKKSRNKEASKQYREKRKHAIKEVFQKQHELEQRNNQLREQLKFMEHLTVNMQKTFAKKMDTKEKIKMEIMKLIKRSVAGNDNVSATDLKTEIAVLQKIFQRVANENLTKGCVEEAIYEILGEVIKQ